MPLFKIATFNANSIRVRLEQILDWLKRETPDVLCIQETKVQDKDFPQSAIEETGYAVVLRLTKVVCSGSNIKTCILSTHMSHKDEI